MQFDESESCFVLPFFTEIGEGGSQESNMLWTYDEVLVIKEGLNGKIISSKTACREIKILRLGGWKHLYPL